MFFRVDFLSFGIYNGDCWWVSLCNIDNFNDFDRSLIHLERNDNGQWVIHLLFMEIMG